MLDIGPQVPSLCGDNFGYLLSIYILTLNAEALIQKLGADWILWTSGLARGSRSPKPVKYISRWELDKKSLLTLTIGTPGSTANILTPPCQ